MEEEKVTKVDLGDTHKAGIIPILNGLAYGMRATCYKCGGLIGEWAYLYQWAHTVRDDPTVSNLLIFCAPTCLIEHLKADSIEELE